MLGVAGTILLGPGVPGEQGLRVDRRDPPRATIPTRPHLATLPPGEQVFFGLYYTMTGLHGLHVLVGIGAAR